MVMGKLNEMIEDINYIYVRYMKNNRGKEYVFARLWDDYYDDNPDEEMIVYNMIIAKKNIEEKIVTDTDYRCIKRVMKNYEDNQEKMKLYLGEEDDKELYRIYDMIKFFRGNV